MPDRNQHARRLAASRPSSRSAALVLALALLALAPAARAEQVSLAGAHFSAHIETDVSLGLWSWIVDGVEHLSQYWSWYGLGHGTQKDSIDTLQSGPVLATSHAVSIPYQHSAFALTAGFEFGSGLAGGGPGSSIGGYAHFTHTVTIQNLTGSRLLMSFFQYMDFDMDEQWDSNIQQAILPGGVQMQHGSRNTVFTTPSLAPSYFTIGEPLDLMDLLDNPHNYTLDNFAGPMAGDLAALLQWNLDLGPGQSWELVLYTELVPEPASAGLLAVGILAMLRRRRTARRWSKGANRER